MFHASRLWRLFLLASVLLVEAWAQGPTTTINDTVYQADGSPAQGTLLISWPAFTTAGGAAVAPGTTSVTLGTGGALSFALVPNQGATPVNTVYTVVYQLSDIVKTEFWSVPTTSPTNLATVRITLGASSAASQMVTQQYVEAAVAAKANDSAVVHLAGTETITGAKEFSAPPSFPTPVQSTDAANKAYVDNSVQNVGGGGPYVSTAGGTMTGPLSLSGNPSSPTQAADKNYVDSWAAVKADLISGLVPPSELATGSPGSGTCLLGNQTWGSCGSGSGSLSINSAQVASPNLNSTVPAAQSSFLNCSFRNTGSNVSLECPYGNTASSFSLGSQTVLNNQANSYGTGLQDFSTAGLKLPAGASYAPAVSGAVGFDSTANMPVINVNGVTQQVALTTSNITGQASTALTLAATPAQCNGSFATGIQANGNANCSTADVVQLAETAQPSGISNYGIFWFDSATHTPRVIDNNGQVVQLGLMNAFNSDANTLEEYNGTNPQTLNVYGTRTDASDYERMRLGYDTTDGYFFLSSEAAGTGTQRGLGFWMQGGLRWVIDASFNLKPWSDNVKDIGSPTLRPKHLYTGTYADLTGGALVTEVPNQTSTGTTLNKLAKVTGAPATAIIASTTDTNVIGVVADGAGTTGSAQIARGGQASCVFDGATTAGDYVQISSTSAGDCHDAGASYPGTGQVLGRVLSTNGAGGTFNLLVSGGDLQAGSGSAKSLDTTVTYSGGSTADRCLAGHSTFFNAPTANGGFYPAIDMRGEIVNGSGIQKTIQCSSNLFPLNANFGGSDPDSGSLWMLPPATFAITASQQLGAAKTFLEGEYPGGKAGSNQFGAGFQAETGFSIGSGLTYSPGMLTVGATPAQLNAGASNPITTPIPSTVDIKNLDLDANSIAGVIPLTACSMGDQAFFHRVVLKNDIAVGMVLGCGSTLINGSGGFPEGFFNTNGACVDQTAVNESSWAIVAGNSSSYILVVTYSGSPTVAPQPGMGVVLTGLPSGNTHSTTIPTGTYVIAAVSTGSSSNIGNSIDVRATNVSGLFTSASQFAIVFNTSQADSNSTPTSSAIEWGTDGIEYNSGTSDKEFNSYSDSASNCVSSLGITPLIGFDTSGGAVDFHSPHDEDYRIGRCIGCAANTFGVKVENQTCSITSTCILISNNWNTRQITLTNIKAPPGQSNTNIIQDLINGNTLTSATQTNGVVLSYIIDSGGTAHLMGVCSEMTNGWCDDGNYNALYVSGSKVWSVKDSNGAATAATPSPGDNSTNIATTAFVATSFAPLASPTFTGTTAAPTPTAGDSSTKLATTAYVQNQTTGIPWLTVGRAGSVSGVTFSTTANQAELWGVVLTFPVTTTQVTYYVGTADNTANSYDVGIYNSSGTLLVHTGTKAGTVFAPAPGATTLSWAASATLQPGKYYLAITTNCTASCAAIDGDNASAVSFLSKGVVAVSAGGTLNSSLTPPADAWSYSAITPAWAVR